MVPREWMPLPHGRAVPNLFLPPPCHLRSVQFPSDPSWAVSRAVSEHEAVEEEGGWGCCKGEASAREHTSWCSPVSRVLVWGTTEGKGVQPLVHLI